MAKCPECETEVEKAYKTWIMKRGETEVEIGLYSCGHCNNRFRKGKRI